MEKQLLWEKVNDYKQQHRMQHTRFIRHFAKKLDPFFIHLNNWLLSKEIIHLPGDENLSLNMFIKYLIQTNSYKELAKSIYDNSSRLGVPSRMYFMDDNHFSHYKSSMNFFSSIFGELTSATPLNRRKTYSLLRYLDDQGLLTEQFIESAMKECRKDGFANEWIRLMMNDFNHIGLLNKANVAFIFTHKEIFVNIYKSEPYQALHAESRIYQQPESLKNILEKVIDTIKAHTHEHQKMIGLRINMIIQTEIASYIAPNAPGLKR